MLFSLLAHVTAAIFLVPLLAAWQVLKALIDKKNENLKIALLLALLLHVAVVLPLVHLLLTMTPDEMDSRRLAVDLWDPSAGKAEEKPTPEEMLEEYEPKEEPPDGKVVRTPKSKDRRKPDKDTPFLAEQDNRVEEESVSRLRLPGMAETSPTVKSEGEDGRDQKTVVGADKEQTTVVGPPPPPHLDRSDKGSIPEAKQAPRSLEDVDLRLSQENAAAVLKGAGLDHLEGVIEGDNTAVNTRGWEFASFFNRVKQQVERYWHPDREYDQHDPYGNIYGFKDRVTVLLVVLRGDGSLKGAYVLDSSGATFLDDEAVEAVEQGAPFPNVPEGLKDKNDGFVKFTFHFIVEVGRSPVFRMRRY